MIEIYRDNGETTRIRSLFILMSSRPASRNKRLFILIGLFIYEKKKIIFKSNVHLEELQFYVQRWRRKWSMEYLLFIARVLLEGY